MADLNPDFAAVRDRLHLESTITTHEHTEGLTPDQTSYLFKVRNALSNVMLDDGLNYLRDILEDVQVSIENNKIVFSNGIERVDIIPDEEDMKILDPFIGVHPLTISNQAMKRRQRVREACNRAVEAGRKKDAERNRRANSDPPMTRYFEEEVSYEHQDLEEVDPLALGEEGDDIYEVAAGQDDIYKVAAGGDDDDDEDMVVKRSQWAGMVDETEKLRQELHDLRRNQADQRVLQQRHNNNNNNRNNNNRNNNNHNFRNNNNNNNNNNNKRQRTGAEADGKIQQRRNHAPTKAFHANVQFDENGRYDHKNRCYSCDGFGHHADRCPRTDGLRRCFCCSKFTDHIAANCPDRLKSPRGRK